MRVVHIIPATFNYFDNIKEFAFDILEKQNSLGIEADAITLQYSKHDIKKDRAVLKQKKDTALQKLLAGEIKIDYPKYNYKGSNTLSVAFENLSDYDLVHLHAPWFGAGEDILNWRRLNPKQPFIVSYYYDFKISDILGIMIKLYGYYYLPKILNTADVVSCIDLDKFAKMSAFSAVDRKDTILPLVDYGVLKNPLTAKNFSVKLFNDDERYQIARRLINVYQLLIS